MKNGAIVTFAVLLLGSSAAIAQPYGDRPYGRARPYNDRAVGPGENACGLNLTGRNAVNYIIDPATGGPVTEAEYLARYPWSQATSWTYDCASNLWTDHTTPPNPGYYPQTQNYERGRERERDRGNERDRERDRDREQDR